MFDIVGKYNKAKLNAISINQDTIKQIRKLCNQEYIKDSNIVIMPDCHYSNGATVGTTLTYDKKISPMVVGSDLGCGVLLSKLDVKEDDINFEELNKVIDEKVKNGYFSYKELLSRRPINRLQTLKVGFEEELLSSLGMLGGGNHFIELSKDSEGSIYLVIHSGSRSVGKKVYDFYSNKAREYCEDKKDVKYKELSYLEGKDLLDYIHDVDIAQGVAQENREIIKDIILKEMGWTTLEVNHVKHNYIDTTHRIVRKGAISAQKGELCVIPLNMRDGSIIGYGKGNKEWNYSAPHGSGRKYSRSESKTLIGENIFKELMRGIYSQGINQSNVDESPLAYKDSFEILDLVENTIELEEILKPIFNYKTH